MKAASGQKAYQHARVNEFIHSMEGRVTNIRMMGKELEMSDNKSIERIKDFDAKKNEVSQQLTSKAAKKSLLLNYLTQEKTVNDSEVAWVSRWVPGWVEQRLEQIKDVKERAKKMESKRLNKTLKEDEITEFANFLSDFAIKHEKQCQEIISALSHLKIKGCCSLIETITAQMQSIKREEGEPKRA